MIQMTKEEKYIARLILKTKIYEADKQAYEDLFTKIKQNENSDFKQVKPQGPLGDGKCDGFIKTTVSAYLTPPHRIHKKLFTVL